MPKKNLVKKTRKLRRGRVNKRKTLHRGGGLFNGLGFYKHTNAIRTLFKLGKGELVITKYNELFSKFGVQEPGTGKCITPLKMNGNQTEDFVIGKYNEALMSITCSTYTQGDFDNTVKVFERWLLEEASKNTKQRQTGAQLGEWLAESKAKQLHPAQPAQMPQPQ